MALVKDKKLKITKVGNVPQPWSPRGSNFESGTAHVGVAANELEVGHSLYLETRAGYFVTSMVRELLGDNRFSTLNSIYHYEFLEEGSDDLGLSGGSGEGVPVRPDIPKRSGGRGEPIPRSELGKSYEKYLKNFRRIFPQKA